MAGCPIGQPSDQTVSAIEARLGQDPCLKNLDHLRRTYTYARRGWQIDFDKVDVEVHSAGYDGLPAGRISAEPPRTNRIDERNYFQAAATYIISKHDLDLWACGGPWNIRHMPRLR